MSLFFLISTSCARGCHACLQFSNLTSRGKHNYLWVKQFKHKQAQTIHTKYVWILPHASAHLNHFRSQVLCLQTRLPEWWSLRDFTAFMVFSELLPFLDTLQVNMSLCGAGVQTDSTIRSLTVAISTPSAGQCHPLPRDAGADVMGTPLLQTTIGGNFR